MSDVVQQQQVQHAQPTPRFVPDRTEDRQWDCRFNVQSDEDVAHSSSSAVRLNVGK